MLCMYGLNDMLNVRETFVMVLNLQIHCTLCMQYGVLLIIYV
jgi:hypothetical protein